MKLPQRKAIRVFVVLLFVLFGANGDGVAQEQQKTAAELAVLCQKFWNEFDKKDVHYSEHRVMTILDTGNKAKDVDTTQHYHWVCNKQCHLLQHLPTEPDGACYSCVRYDGKVVSEECVVIGKDEVLPSSLDDAVKRNLRAGVVQCTPASVLSLFPEHSVFGMRFESSQSGAAPIDFYQYISNCSATVPQREQSETGDVLWSFRVDFLNYEKWEDNEKPYCIITINESKDYFIHGFVSVVPASASNATDTKTGKKLAIYSERKVTDYIKLADGHFFPKKIITGFGPRIAWEKRKHFPDDFYATQYDITDVRMNNEAASNVRFDIPEFYIVYRDDLLTDQTKEGDFAVCSIWGKNNEPLVTFQSAAEYDEYMKERLVMPLKKAHFSTARILLITSGLVLIILSILMRHYFRENKT